jgi:hypothetical protein
MKQFRNTQYYITDKLEIYNIITKRFVKPYLAQYSKNSTKRYNIGLYIDGSRKNLLYHRILAEVFIPNPNNLPQINHIDGNPLNNNISNLEWCSALKNNLHAIHTGLRPTKLDQDKADDIRKQLSNKVSVKDIMSQYNIGTTIISKIRNNISWVKPSATQL